MTDKKVTMILITVSDEWPADTLRESAAKGVIDEGIRNDAGERIGTLTGLWFDEDAQALMGTGVVPESVAIPKTDRIRLVQ